MPYYIQKTLNGIKETIDEFTEYKEAVTAREEYATQPGAYRISSRPCKEWKLKYAKDGFLPSSIQITWDVQDVLEVRPDLNDYQCRQVLQHAKSNHDASVGINWDSLTASAEHLFPEE